MSDEALGVLSDGRYRLDSILGEGGMAVVYKAWDTRLRVFRAIKVLLPAVAQRDSLRTRFESEAQTMARLHHPNILTVHDVSNDDGRPYMVMELVHGGSMADLIEQQGSMLADEAMRMCAQVLQALQFAHEDGVVHRDIKPANILITRHGVPKVADFGIARVMRTDRTRTRTGSLMGTWTYMAPELRADATKASPQSDIYAVATMLYVAISGRKPFDLHASNLHERLFEDIPRSIQAILAKGGSYFPEQRFTSAEEMRISILDACEDFQKLPAEERERLTGPPASDTLSPPSGDAAAPPASPVASVETISFGEFDEPPVMEPSSHTQVPMGIDAQPHKETISFERSSGEHGEASEAPQGVPPMALSTIGEGGSRASVSASGLREQTPAPAADPLPGEALEPSGFTAPARSAAAIKRDLDEPAPRNKRSLLLGLGGAAALLIAAAVGSQLFGTDEMPQRMPESTSTGSSPSEVASTPQHQAHTMAEPVATRDTIGSKQEPVAIEAPPPPPPSLSTAPEPEPTPAPSSAKEPPPSAPAPEARARPASSTATPTVAPAPTPEPEAVEVYLLVLADPMDGTVLVDSRSAAVGAKIAVTEGVHSFQFEGKGWEQRCKKLVTTGAEKIKFTQGAEGCELF